MTTSTPPDVHRKWSSARRLGDYGLLTEVALDNFESRESAPEWLRQEIDEVCRELADDLRSNLDRRDDSEAAVQLIQLSSLTANMNSVYVMLGLAYQAVQPCEQGGRVNPAMPDLLDTHLRILDRLPEDQWPAFLLQWRALAINRVQALVRLDHARRVHAIRGQYAEVIGKARSVRAATSAEEDLDLILSALPILQQARVAVSCLLPRLKDEGERRTSIEDIIFIDGLIEAGRELLPPKPS